MPEPNLFSFRSVLYSNEFVEKNVFTCHASICPDQVGNIELTIFQKSNLLKEIIQSIFVTTFKQDERFYKNTCHICVR